MKFPKFGHVAIIICLCLYCCGLRDYSYRNKIEFRDHEDVVADSISVMINLIEKFPKTHTATRGYYVDNGQFWVNAINSGLSVSSGSTDQRLRNSFEFQNMTSEQIDQFFRLVTYLLENHINAAHYEPAIGVFIFTYHKVENEDSNTGRYIMLKIKNESDMSEYFKVIDTTEKLFLITSIYTEGV